MKIGLTCNGPGEFAGWVRPLARCFADLAPHVQVHVFFLPDDYATGREADVAERELPNVHIHRPTSYMSLALRGAPQLGRFGAVVYLGGDILHARLLQARLGGELLAYRYVPKIVAGSVTAAYALDADNATRLRTTVPADRVRVVGNIAVDGAYAQAAGHGAPIDRVIPDAVLFMPGSRRHEVRHLWPFFATVATVLRASRPDIPIVFGASPFTERTDIEQALRGPLEPKFYARPGRIIDETDGIAIVVDEHLAPFPIVRSALANAVQARLAVTIPGTKSIELAALGVAHAACVPFNLPEGAVMNGPLTYLDRLPWVGRPLKRAAILRFAGRFQFFTQPNMDAQQAVIPEWVGTLTPGDIAHRIEQLVDAREWQAQTGAVLRDLYRDHRGATERMARAILRDGARP